jgi:hypothetical protein
LSALSKEELMAIQIQSTNTASLKHGVKCIIYGNSGVGKTRLSASAPNPIILSAENGLLSLRQFNLPFIQIKNVDELTKAYDYLVGPQGKQFQTIVLDSVSEIAEICLNDAKKSNRDARKAYGDTQDEILDIFRKFRDIVGKHVVFLAKQEYINDGLTGGKTYAPSFPGNKLAQAAPYFMDEVWQLIRWKDNEGKPYWGLRTQPDNQNAAKDRSGCLLEFENADPATGGGLSYLFQKMLNS